MIAALAGRRIDPPNPQTARFPPGRVQQVQDAIERGLHDDGVTMLVCAAACGADLLALAAAERLGVRRRIVLPFSVAIFRERSVVDRPSSLPWGEWYDRFVNEARRAGDLRLLGFHTEDPGVYEKTNEGILDEALRAAEQSQSTAEAIAVWDRRLRSERDFTEHFARQAELRHLSVKSIAIVDEPS